VDAAALVAPRVSAGVGYRRWNYDVGAVDVVMPHITIETPRTSWTIRGFVSRNPSKRTDAAAYLRMTRALTRRTTVSLLGGAGRESYLVGGAIQSLKTLSGIAGIRYNASSRTTIRFDVSGVRSRPILSRNGVALGVERGL